VHRGDELAVAQQHVAVGFIPGQPVQLGKRDSALAVRAVDLDHDVERGQRHGHVREVGRHTVFGGAEDGVVAAVPVDR
jgi:hypothetical protein